jgi:hypothetical protein
MVESDPFKMQWPNHSTRQGSLSAAAYILWNIWNERNRRIFQGKKLYPNKKVVGKSREELPCSLLEPVYFFISLFGFAM